MPLISILVYFANLLPTETGFKNLSNQPIPLRQNANWSEQPIQFWPENVFVKLEYSAVRWVYVNYKNNIYTVPKRLANTAYIRIGGLFSLKLSHFNVYNNVISKYGDLLIFTFMTIWSYIVFTQLKKQREKKIFLKAPHSNQGNTYSISPNLTQATLEKEFIESVRRELEIKYQGKFEQMQSAALSLQNEYKKKCHDAKLLGIDLEDSKNLANLIKGRLFEVYAAKFWDSDININIVDWTPDKGFHENIYIQSNGNPDFLLETNKNGLSRIAVECKYRTSTFKLHSKTLVKLESQKKHLRYDEYSQKNNIPVFILIGLAGKADKPESIYLVPNQKLIDSSQVDKFNDKCILFTELQNYKISLGNFARFF